MSTKLEFKRSLGDLATTFPYAPSPSNSPLVHRTDPVRAVLGTSGSVLLLLQEATSLAGDGSFSGVRHCPSHPGLPQPTQPVL